jgi:hypothetical protein
MEGRVERDGEHIEAIVTSVFDDDEWWRLEPEYRAELAEKYANVPVDDIVSALTKEYLGLHVSNITLP